MKQENQIEKTQTSILMEKYSLEEIKQTWFELGMYKTGERFLVSPHAIHYLALKHGWQRELPEHLKKAHLNGNWNSMKTNFITNTTNQN